MSAQTCAAGTDDDYARLVASVFETRIDPLADAAERCRQFPREVFEILGREGVFARKWTRADRQDLGRMVTLAEHLGRTGSAGIGVGVSLHDSAISVLRRFGRNDYLVRVAERATAGESVLCIAASEFGGGSDLQSAQSFSEPEGDGYRLRGEKKFVSLTGVADYALVVVRGRSDDGTTPWYGDIALFLVPIAQLTLGPPYRTVSANCLGTGPISFDTWVPRGAMIARPGAGLAAISWGLGHERLSVAAQIASAATMILQFTVAHMKRRSQFGKTLFEHQALRLRIADLYSRVEVLRMALRTFQLEQSPLSLRTAAALKVSAARLGEEVAGECMHVFGGSGYLVEETPVSRWWRDMKLGRVGGGTDEILWELVAAGIAPADDSYDRLVQR